MKRTLIFIFLLLVPLEATANPVGLEGLESTFIGLAIIVATIPLLLLGLAYRKIAAGTITRTKLVLFLLPPIWLGISGILGATQGMYNFSTSNDQSVVHSLDIPSAAMFIYLVSLLALSGFVFNKYRRSRKTPPQIR